jgi:hypothetical protein
VYLAVDPDYYVPLQTGWLWIFTPVKGDIVVHGSLSPITPWFDLYLYDSHYLDLRVVALDILILVILTIVIPNWRRQHQRGGQPWGFLSATAGMLFGLTVTGVSFFALSNGKIVLASGVLTLVLYYVSLSRIVLRHKTHS